MPHSPPSRLLLPILCLLAALGIFSTSLYLPSLPAIGTAFNASQEAVQLTLALCFLGSAVGSLVLGPIADRVGRLLVAKGGLILFILTSLWCAQATSILSLQIGRFLQGAAASAGPLVARAMGRDLYEGADLTRLSATIMMVISISPAIAPILGGGIEFYFGWEKNFYFLMLFGFIIAVMIWLWLPETHVHRQDAFVLSSIFRNYVLLLKDSYYALLCFIIAFQMGAIFCYISLSPYLFISYFKWSPQEYGYIGLTIALGNILGSALARRLAQRLSFHQGILIGSSLCFLLSLAFGSLCFFSPISSFLLIFYSLCFFMACTFSVVNAVTAALNLFPHMAGTSSAMIGAVQIGSGAFGSALASILPLSPFFLTLALGGLSLMSLMVGSIIEKKTWLGR